MKTSKPVEKTSRWPTVWFVLGTVTLAIEFALKLAAWKFRREFEILNIADQFSLNVVYVENRHSAFGMMRAVPDWINHSLLGLSIIFLVALTVHTAKNPEASCMLRKGIFCFVIGAIGNMVDRLLVGAVVDYIDFRLGPEGSIYMLAWNISDLVINLGFAFVILDSLNASEPKSGEKKHD